MSRDKQTEIEKITDVLDKCTYDNKLKDEMALMLYNAGYRKSTDLAEEIFAELDRLMLDGEIGGKYPAKVINPDKYSELKKKYTESEKNDGN